MHTLSRSIIATWEGNPEWVTPEAAKGEAKIVKCLTDLLIQQEGENKEIILYGKLSRGNLREGFEELIQRLSWGLAFI